MHVQIDPGRCNGNATCVLEVPDVFDLSDDDNLAHVVLDPVGEEHRAAVEAMVVSCPTQAISTITNPTESRRTRSAADLLVDTRFRRGCRRIGNERHSSNAESI